MIENYLNILIIHKLLLNCKKKKIKNTFLASFTAVP